MLDWLKQVFSIKVTFPPIIPDSSEIMATFKEPLELMDASTTRMVKVEEGIYPLIKAVNPCSAKGDFSWWLMIEGTQQGAVKEWWEDQILEGRVVLE